MVTVLTPNAASLFTAISLMIPYRLKQILKSRLFGGYEEDTFPTHYRVNRARTLKRLMSDAGFRQERFEYLAGMWTFFIFSKYLALTVRFLEHVQLRTPGARHLSTYLMGVWVKP